MKLRKVYACILTLCMLVSMLPAFAADTDASCTHKWTEKVIKEANCTQTGLVKKTCELCGALQAWRGQGSCERCHLHEA
mgnify:CR=1 FL=1